VGGILSQRKRQRRTCAWPISGKGCLFKDGVWKRVCGASAVKKETIIVENVDKFPGHIVCDALSRSEIVVPVIIDNIAVGVLDIDSDNLGNFDATDKNILKN